MAIRELEHYLQTISKKDLEDWPIQMYGEYYTCRVCGESSNNRCNLIHTNNCLIEAQQIFSKILERNMI